MNPYVGTFIVTWMLALCAGVFWVTKMDHTVKTRANNHFWRVHLARQIAGCLIVVAPGVMLGAMYWAVNSSVRASGFGVVDLGTIHRSMEWLWALWAIAAASAAYACYEQLRVKAALRHHIQLAAPDPLL